MRSHISQLIYAPMNHLTFVSVLMYLSVLIFEQIRGMLHILLSLYHVVAAAQKSSFYLAHFAKSEFFFICCTVRLTWLGYV